MILRLVERGLRFLFSPYSDDSLGLELGQHSNSALTSQIRASNSRKTLHPDTQHLDQFLCLSLSTWLTSQLILNGNQVIISDEHDLEAETVYRKSINVELQSDHNNRTK